MEVIKDEANPIINRVGDKLRSGKGCYGLGVIYREAFSGSYGGTLNELSENVIYTECTRLNQILN